MCLSAKLFSGTYHCKKELKWIKMSTLSCLCPRVLLNIIIFTVLIVLTFPHWLFYSIFLPYCLSYLIHMILLHYIIITIQKNNECFFTAIELSLLIINNLNLLLFLSVCFPPVPSPPPGVYISPSAPALTASTFTKKNWNFLKKCFKKLLTASSLIRSASRASSLLSTLLPLSPPPPTAWDRKK